jgi:hypothetical protein
MCACRTLHDGRALHNCLGHKASTVLALAFALVISVPTAMALRFEASVTACAASPCYSLSASSPRGIALSYSRQRCEPFTASALHTVTALYLNWHCTIVVGISCCWDHSRTCLCVGSAVVVLTACCHGLFSWPVVHGVGYAYGSLCPSAFLQMQALQAMCTVVALHFMPHAPGVTLGYVGSFCLSAFLRLVYALH